LHVRGDAHRLRRALGTLLGNALRLTRSGGEVRMVVQPARAYVDVIVDSIDIACDEGPSERTAREASRSTGSIGLQVARRVVELHDGTLTIDEARADGKKRVSVRLLLQQTSASN